MKYGQVLQGDDAKVPKIGDFLDNAGVCTALRRRNARTWVASKSAHMELVNYGLGKWPLERQITLPVIVITLSASVAMLISRREILA